MNILTIYIENKIISALFYFVQCFLILDISRYCCTFLNLESKENEKDLQRNEKILRVVVDTFLSDSAETEM